MIIGYDPVNMDDTVFENVQDIKEIINFIGIVIRN